MNRIFFIRFVVLSFLFIVIGGKYTTFYYTNKEILEKKQKVYSFCEYFCNYATAFARTHGASLSSFIHNLYKDLLAHF